MNVFQGIKRRAKEGILQKIGTHTATEDTMFELRFRNFQSQVSELVKIKDAMILWLDSLEAFCLTSNILSESFANYFTQPQYKYTKGDQPPIMLTSSYSAMASTFEKISIDMKTIMLPSIKQVFNTRCLNPVVSILSLIPLINEQIQARKLLLLDFDSYKSKHTKEIMSGREASHPKMIKINGKLDASARKLEAITNSIYTSFDEFDEAKPTILGAEFSCFIGCFYHMSFHSSDLAAKLLPQIPQIASTLSMLDDLVKQFAIEMVHTNQRLNAAIPNPTAPANNSAQQTNRTDENNSSPEIISESEQAANEMLNKGQKIVPVLHRTTSMGGAMGGYGHVSSTKSDFEFNESNDVDPLESTSVKEMSATDRDSSKTVRSVSSMTRRSIICQERRKSSDVEALAASDTKFEREVDSDDEYENVRSESIVSDNKLGMVLYPKENPRSRISFRMDPIVSEVLNQVHRTRDGTTTNSSSDDDDEVSSFSNAPTHQDGESRPNSFITDTSSTPYHSNNNSRPSSDVLNNHSSSSEVLITKSNSIKNNAFLLREKNTNSQETLESTQKKLIRGYTAASLLPSHSGSSSDLHDAALHQLQSSSGSQPSTPIKHLKHSNSQSQNSIPEPSSLLPMATDKPDILTPRNVIEEKINPLAPPPKPPKNKPNTLH